MYQLKSKLYPEIKDVKLMWERRAQQQKLGSVEWTSVDQCFKKDQCYLVLIAIFVVRKSKN